MGVYVPNVTIVRRSTGKLIEAIHGASFPEKYMKDGYGWTIPYISKTNEEVVIYASVHDDYGNSALDSVEVNIIP